MCRGVHESALDAGEDQASCPLCRGPIDDDIIDHAKTSTEEFERRAAASKDDWQWKYSGRTGGWWLFEDRANAQIEEGYQTFLKAQRDEAIAAAVAVAPPAPAPAAAAAAAPAAAAAAAAADASDEPAKKKARLSDGSAAPGGAPIAASSESDSGSEDEGEDDEENEDEEDGEDDDSASSAPSSPAPAAAAPGGKAAPPLPLPMPAAAPAPAPGFGFGFGAPAFGAFGGMMAAAAGAFGFGGGGGGFGFGAPAFPVPAAAAAGGPFGGVAYWGPALPMAAPLGVGARRVRKARAAAAMDSNPARSIRLVVGARTYVIDFLDMTQARTRCSRDNRNSTAAMCLCLCLAALGGLRQLLTPCTSRCAPSLLVQVDASDATKKRRLQRSKKQEILEEFEAGKSKGTKGQAGVQFVRTRSLAKRGY